MASRASELTGNRVLSGLPERERANLAPLLEPVQLQTREILFDVDEPIREVHFPISGVVSIISPALEGAAVEVATIGNEGMVGLPVALGADRTSLQAFSQVPGLALRMQAEDLERELAGGSALRRQLDLYTQALFTQVAQSSACNRLHSIEERCARWLLLTHDRVSSDAFPLTHEFLAQMLGVRRASVSQVAERLKRRGLVEYRRGTMRILDREQLERVSCECYGIIRGEYDRLLAGKPSAPILREVRQAIARDRRGRAVLRSPMKPERRRGGQTEREAGGGPPEPG